MTETTRMQLYEGGSPTALDAYHRWLASGADVPVQQRPSWPAVEPGETWRLLTLEDREGRVQAAAGLRAFPLRSLPGFRALRVLKFGHALPESLVAPLLSALRDVATADARVVRLHIEGFSSLPGGIERLRGAARALGFTEEAAPREYARTLLVDLRGTDEEFVGRFHRMVMKNVRKSERAGHVVAPITDERFADRLAALVHETMSRTGALAQPADWHAIVRQAREHPATFRLSGLFVDGQQTPESLAAFRWCACSGERADDLVAASTRLRAETGSVPMMPAVMLDVFRWARGQGATWFDFGGIVEPDDPRYATLGSITDFKKLFGDTIATVGADFRLETRPVLSRLGGAVSALAHRIRSR